MHWYTLITMTIGWAFGFGGVYAYDEIKWRRRMKRREELGYKEKYEELKEEYEGLKKRGLEMIEGQFREDCARSNRMMHEEMKRKDGDA